jgi:hypothetical protein
VNPKVKITKEEKVEMRPLIHNTLRVRGVCWSPEMGIRMSDKHVTYSHELAQTKQQVG